MTGAFEAITSTDKSLSYLHRAPAFCAVDISHHHPRVQAATTRGTAGDTRKTRRQKREHDSSPLSRAVVAGDDDAVSRQRRSSASALPQERLQSNHPNKCVKWSAGAGASGSTDGTIRRSSSVLAGGRFRQRDQGRQRPPVFGR